MDRSLLNAERVNHHLSGAGEFSTGDDKMKAQVSACAILVSINLRRSEVKFSTSGSESVRQETGLPGSSGRPFRDDWDG